MKIGDKKICCQMIEMKINYKKYLFGQMIEIKINYKNAD